jgi:hypothetical protein
MIQTYSELSRRAEKYAAVFGSSYLELAYEKWIS